MRAELSRGIRVAHLNRSCSAGHSESNPDDVLLHSGLSQNAAAYMAMCTELRRRIFCTEAKGGHFGADVASSKEREEFGEGNNAYVYSIAFGKCSAAQQYGMHSPSKSDCVSS
jgi:hypothetical protein